MQKERNTWQHMSSQYYHLIRILIYARIGILVLRTTTATRATSLAYWVAQQFVLQSGEILFQMDDSVKKECCCSHVRRCVRRR